MPIYWNKKPEEKAQVLEVAGRVEQLVSELGASTGLDTTNKHTPGQKFRFWCGSAYSCAYSCADGGL